MHDIYVVDVIHGDELSSVARIRELVDEVGARNLAFMVTAVPNDTPLETRLDDWIRRFRILREGLQGTPARAGLLIQALIGHGDRGRLATELPFQKIVGADGAECRESFCPLDPAFQAYTQQLITALAQEAPAFFMIDDDFRIAYHEPAHKGCMCPLHLARFAEMTGIVPRREALLAHLEAGDVETREQWEALKQQSLVELASVIRCAIDSVDATIPGSLCTVMAEAHFAQPIADALAGQARPLVRVHNAFYLEGSAKGFPERVSRTVREIALLSKETIVLTEADTCPHNRHSLSTTSHLAHIATTTLAGCRGAKYWFVKTGAEGWAEMAPFRALLRRTRPFLDAVSALRDHIEWLGPRVVARTDEVLRKPWEQEQSLDFVTDDWGWRVFGRLGIPFTVATGADDGDAPRALCRTAPLAYSATELRAFLSGALLLDGEAAWHLYQRGLGDYLGVDVLPTPFACDAELLHVIPESSRTHEVPVGMIGAGRYRLQATSEDTRVVSSFVAGTTGRYTPVAPALTWYDNALGGRIAVYGLSMQAPLEWVFYNSRRKAQLVETLTWLGWSTAPVVVETDLDVYAMHGQDTCEDGLQYLCLLDLNPDPLEEVVIRLPGGPVQTAERLSLAGTWEPVAFSTDGPRLRCDTTAAMMEPVILRLRS